jgi:hypothetical protein
MDLLYSRVLEPFLSRFDGEITRNAWELKEHQWRREEMSTFCVLSKLNRWGKRRDVGGDREKV